MLGIDSGASYTKVCYVSDDNQQYFFVFPTSLEELEKFFRIDGDGNITAEENYKNTKKISVFGGGSVKYRSFFDKLKIKPVYLDELITQSNGVKVLLKSKNNLHYYGNVKDIGDRYIIASMGTGVSFSLVSPERLTHIGGSALGGGTLLGLAKYCVGTTDFDDIYTCSTKGDPDSLALLLADVYGGDYGTTLKSNCVASYFAKAALVDVNPTKNDLCASLVSTICYSIGAQLAQACKAYNTDCIVLIGGFLKSEGSIPYFLARALNLWSKEAFIVIPNNFRYSGSIGAAYYLNSV